MMNPVRIMTVAVLAVLLGLAAVGRAQTAAGPQVVPGVTQPIRMQLAKLTLEGNGVIRQVMVKPGDRVKKGQLLIQLNDNMEQVKLRQAETEANSMARVDEAKANIEVKKSVLKRKEGIVSSGAGATSEVEEARLDVIDAEARLKIAELDQAKAKLDAEAAHVLIDRMKLLSPFDGIVEAVDASVGEVIDPNRQGPVITLVQTTPLWVEIRNMPAAWAQKLKIGDKLEVRYDERYAGTPMYDAEWAPAAVVYKSAVADAQSDTQLVRLEMANVKNVDAGLQVQVRLPASITGLTEAK